MFLSVKEMELRKIRFDETVSPGRIEWSSENLEQASPLETSGSAEVVPHSGGEVRIRGRFTVEMGAECDRCLRPARFPLISEFDLFYRPAAGIPKAEEVEIHPAEAEIGFYEDGLELDDLLREQVLLALPMQRVCAGDCKGICPICGVDRNQTACDCHSLQRDDRWGALRDLK